MEILTLGERWRLDVVRQGSFTAALRPASLSRRAFVSGSPPVAAESGDHQIGVNGIVSNQTPVASCKAATRAGASGRNGISPTPRAPQGPLGSGLSTMTECTSSGMSPMPGIR